MIGKSLVAGVALVFATAAQAATPTAAQKADFYETCMQISGGNTELCSCKADAAMTIIDAEFMAVVISSMKGKTPTDAQNGPYNVYIGKSNQICKPGY